MFREKPVRRFPATSAVIDLEGFTSFCKQPDNHTKLASFLNVTFDRVAEIFKNFQIDQSILHFKFLGDGALYIWELPDDVEQCKNLNKTIVLALHDLFRVFPDEALDVADDQGRAMPRRLRVGIAQGELTELVPTKGDKEYVGFSINMAARLQKYCPQIGFLVSQSVSLSEEFLEDYSFVKVTTKKITGMDGVKEDVRYVSQDAADLKKKKGKREIEKWFMETSTD